MKIAVTGASGFLGKYLVEILTSNEFQVKALSRKSRISKISNLTWIKGELNDSDSHDLFLSGCDVICNCAGEINNQDNFKSSNIEGVKKIYESSIRFGVKLFIHVSSAGIYKEKFDGSIDEDHGIFSENSYEDSKVQAENFLLNSTSLRTVILRPTTIYGPDMPNESLKALFKTVLERKFFFIGSRRVISSYISVKNVADAIKRVIERNDKVCIDENNTNIYNISDDVLFSEFISIVSKKMRVQAPKLRFPLFIISLLLWLNDHLIGLKLPLTKSRLKHLTKKSTFSSEKYIKTYSWYPPIPHEETIDECVQSWFKI